MCFDQPYCLSEYVFWRDLEPVVSARVSLTTRAGGGAAYTTLAAEFLTDCDAWSIWTPCDFPSVLASLGIPLSASHPIMDQVTDGLAVSPSVTVALDGGVLGVELLPAPPAPTS